MSRSSLLALAAAAAAAAVAAVLSAAARKRRSGNSGKPSAKQLDKLETVILKNRDGVEVHITPVGASIQRFILPLGQGERRDVVLGFNKASTYALLAGTPYFGAVVGRVANRIAGGRFKLEGKEYMLAQNNGPNALHGGPGGFHTRVFKVLARDFTAKGSSVTLQYTSPDGEEGYPGTLVLTVTYELLAHSPELNMTFAATTDQATPVNIAQHSYFNLHGHSSGKDITDHSVRLAADHYTPVNDVQIPTGEILPVAGTVFDFSTEAHTVGERLQQVPGGEGYDLNYVLFGMGPQAKFITKHQAAASTPRLAATVTEPGSGLALEVLTTTPGMQFYTGGFLGDAFADAKDGAVYPRFGGLCLEAQSFPDSINQPAFPSVVLQPGETYRQQLVYRFTVLQSQQS